MNLTVIAPSEGQLPISLPIQECNQQDYSDLIDEIQRFRGRVYVQDEAIPEASLDETGRQYSEVDYRSWHVVARTDSDAICGVMRIPFYSSDTDIDNLQLNSLLQRLEPSEQLVFRHTIQSFLEESSGTYEMLCEPGGWAVDLKLISQSIGTSLAACGLAVVQWIGSAISVSTVTVKHNAPKLLKYMGAWNPLQHTSHERFKDWYHSCEMEIIFFAHDRASAQLIPIVEQIKGHIENTGVLVYQPVTIPEDAYTN
jgi:hypothetical protein